MTIQQRKSRREFLYATGAAGLFAAGASTISLTALADQLHQTSLWPARVPDTSGRSTPTPPQLGIRVYSKLGFGPRPGDLQDFNSRPGNNSAKFTAWLDDQLLNGANPNAPDDAVTSRLNSDTYETLDRPLNLLWRDYHRYDGANGFRVRQRPYYEMQTAMLTRAVHSQWQLREVLADFWHNHFNVDGGEEVVRSVLPDYDRNVIRSDMFGNFRIMLEKVVKHASMMYYLDNRRNSTPRPNENYARELLELHTLGAVENYYGFVDPSTVPNNSDGEPAGYVEADVLEMARLLTGFGVADGDDDAPDTGEYLFREEWHDGWRPQDDGIKTIMGQVIPYDPQGEAELTQILDFLCQHRGTAEYICWKLAVRLIGDGQTLNDPFTASSPIVQSAADLFQATSEADDQLTQIYRHMLDTNIFKQTWGVKARRPIEIICSALRAANVDYDFELRDSNSVDARPFSYMDRIRDAGQAPFNCEPPTGYAEDRAIWKGSNPLVMSWRAITNMIRDFDSAAGFDGYVNLAQQNNAEVGNLTPNAITDYWLNRVLGFGHNTAADKRDVIVAFLNNNSGNGGADQLIFGGDVDEINDVTQNSQYQQLMRGLFCLVALLPERMIR